MNSEKSSSNLSGSHPLNSSDVSTPTIIDLTSPVSYVPYVKNTNSQRPSLLTSPKLSDFACYDTALPRSPSTRQKSSKSDSMMIQVTGKSLLDSDDVSNSSNDDFEEGEGEGEIEDEDLNNDLNFDQDPEDDLLPSISQVAASQISHYTAPIAANVYSPGFQPYNPNQTELDHENSYIPNNYTQFVGFNRDLFYLPYANSILKDFDFQTTTPVNDEFSLAQLEHELSFYTSETEKVNFLLGSLKKSEEAAKVKLNVIKDFSLKINLGKLMKSSRHKTERDEGINDIKSSASNQKPESIKTEIKTESEVKLESKPEPITYTTILKDTLKGLNNLDKKVSSNQILRELVQQTESAIDRYTYKIRKN